MGQPYILCLGVFVSTTEKNDDGMSDFTEINAVSRAKINFEFQYALSNRGAFAKISRPPARDFRSNLGAALAVF